MKYPNILINSPVSKAASNPSEPTATNDMMNDKTLTTKKANRLAPNNILNGISLFAGQMFA